MSVAHAQILKIRLFIEGIEVPVISAQVTCAPNSPAVAVIQIPPLSSGTKLHPRSIVHLFFLDLYKSNAAVELGQKAQDSEQRGERNPSLRDKVQGRDGGQGGNRDQDLNNHNWKLLFGGEVVGFQWTKQTTRRALILQCEDWSNYWDYAFQADNTGVFGPGLKAIFSGASSNLFTDFLTSKAGAITGIVTSGRCNTFPNLKGLAAGIVRLIEAIGGSYYRWGNDPPKRIAGQNIFFSYNELRLHLTQMIGTLEQDATGERILRRQGYNGMFQRALGGQGGQVSIRQAITALTKIMFYEMYPQACPKYNPGTFGEVSGTRRIKMRDHPQLGGFASIAEAASSSLQESLDALNAFVEPALSGAALAALNQTVRAEIDRLTSVRDNLRNSRAIMEGAPEQVKGQFSAASNSVSSAVVTLRRIITGPSVVEELGLTSRRRKSKRQTLVDGTIKIASALGSLIGVGDAVIIQGGGRDRRPAQLYQQVFKPDIWFGAPARCNVLFPENYDTMSYQRMFLQEPTRLLLKTNDEFFGPDILFDKFYFAPKAATATGARADLRQMLRRGLLDHERFTGILPLFEKMGEFNVYASRAETQRRRLEEAQTGTTQGPSGPKNALFRSGVQKIGLAQRSTNFLYFRHRFNARRMQVKGKFNPYIAVGFPGLIIDKYVDRETIERHNELRKQANSTNPDGSTKFPDIEIAEILGTNFLGNFTQVVHHVAQDQPMGSTNITVTFPRQAEETVEFLGSRPEEMKVKRKLKDSIAKRSYDIAAITPPQVFSLGPNKGKITNVQEVTQIYQTNVDPENIPASDQLAVYLGGARSRLEQSTLHKPQLVPVGVPIPAGSLGSQLLVDIVADGDPTRIVTFRGFRITEEIPRFRREEALMPPEEFIRPGWYGESWTNAKIGEVYQELIGTGSITDPQVVSDLGRNTSTVRSEEGQRAATLQNDAETADDAAGNSPALLALEENTSIQKAVEFIHLTYSYVRQAGLDVDEFIGAYTWRPVASLLDIFGTADLQYSNDGEAIVSGFEGFHSRAFGPYENLFGLVGAELEDVVGIKRGSTAAAKIDVRKARREQVERYVAQLLFSSAILG